MAYALKLLLGPDEEPVSLDEQKAQSRIDTDDDDLLIADKITEARETLERRMGRQFLTATWLLGLDAFPACGWLRLPRPPLQSVQTITYLDADGATQTLATSLYGVDTLSEPGILYRLPSQSWPCTYGVPNAVQITFVAGWDDVLYVPAGIKAAIKLLVAHWYENREATVEKALHDVQEGIERLVWLHRVMEAA